MKEKTEKFLNIVKHECSLYGCCKLTNQQLMSAIDGTMRDIREAIFVLVTNDIIDIKYNYHANRATRKITLISG